MFVLTKSPTMKTLSKMTMSKKTTMTTVRHRDLENDWSSSPFSTVHVVCIQRVLWSLWCRCLLHGRVVRPCVGLGRKPVHQKKRRTSVFHLLFCQMFHVGFRVSLFVHAHLALLVLEVELHDRSVILFRCGTQKIYCFLVCL